MIPFPPQTVTDRPRRGRGRRFGPPPTAIAIELVNGREDLFMVFQNPGAAQTKHSCQSPPSR